MKEQIKDKFVQDFNGGLKTLIDYIITHNVGFPTDFEASTSYYPWAGHVVTLTDKGNGATEALTATPILRQMFKDATLKACVGFDDEKNLWVLLVQIEYNHSFQSGSNGLDLMRVYINATDGGNIVELTR